MKLQLQEFRKVSLIQLLSRYGGDVKTPLLRFCNKYNRVLMSSRASGDHHPWVGGYSDFVAECLRIHLAFCCLKRNADDVLPFDEDDAVMVLFFHDVAAMFRYAVIADKRVDRWQEQAKHSGWVALQPIIQQKVFETLGLNPSQKIWDALAFVAGDGDENPPSALADHARRCVRTSVEIYPWCGQSQQIAIPA